MNKLSKSLASIVLGSLVAGCSPSPDSQINKEQVQLMQERNAELESRNKALEERVKYSDANLLVSLPLTSPPMSTWRRYLIREKDGKAYTDYIMGIGPDLAQALEDKYEGLILAIPLYDRKEEINLNGVAENQPIIIRIRLDGISDDANIILKGIRRADHKEENVYIGPMYAHGIINSRDEDKTLAPEPKPEPRRNETPFEY